MTASGITLHVDRDRVHAGDDDFPPYRMIGATYALRGGATVGDALDVITGRGPDRYTLASIAGGATWVLYGGPARRVALAVVTDSIIEEVRMVADRGLALSSLAGTDGAVRFHFGCLQQADPQETWQRLRDESPRGPRS
ncbi:hypothetical protein [Streptomyces sp. NPDC059063]|uniref:hypothetical protein n=1 Tax=unclassified Streptomyces TaxID=2593676 RepID=UPI0036C909E8